ncbi:hypothetical protein [Mycolicibacterium fortuitum]|uniref:hypothetical protein n=1 Tax=Mycolicibacterium fortuitum TaxID=1766 RepID=UPI00260375D1|nr:hypothetical protein [Mycolicibacterium fortuitum]
MPTAAETEPEVEEAVTPAAWLRQTQIELTDEQLARFTMEWDVIAERYAGDRGLREAARVGAAWYAAGLMTPQGIAGPLAGARRAAEEMLAVARSVATMAVDDGEPEATVARTVGVDRMALRKWLGKR